MATQTGWSADGQWFWDGSKWNDSVSADGRFRYNGTAWEPFSGIRSPMPAQPFGAPAAPAPAAPIAPIPPPATQPAPPAAEEEYPSWLAPSEIAGLLSAVWPVPRENAWPWGPVQILVFLLARLLDGDLKRRLEAGEIATAGKLATMALAVGILNAACMTY